MRAPCRHRSVAYRRRTVLACALGALVLLAAPCRADREPAVEDGRPSAGGVRGWGYLVDKLIHDGVPAERVRRVFDDPRMPPFTELYFSITPHESSAMYRRFLQPASVSAACRCRTRHAEAFEAAAREQGVPANLVAAIIYVESGCGQNTGRQTILPRLARLAMANAPDNLALNAARQDSEDTAKVRARAQYLEDTFYPEVRATFTIADRMGVDPLDIRGSGSGAFGFPQFLPTSYLEHGVDADGDGQVSLEDMTDSAASCAKYLAGHGWKPNLSTAEQRNVIWQYNRSTAYIDAVLTLAARVDGPPPAVRATRAPRSRTRAARKQKPTPRRRGRAAPNPDAS
jgi:membrane-bound lytic murein transglycosylase B